MKNSRRQRRTRPARKAEPLDALPDSCSKPRTRKRPEGPLAEPTLPDLIKAGLLPTPLQLQLTFRRQVVTAQVREDGTILCQGQIHTTLSAAASFAHTLIDKSPSGRKHAQPDGWMCWKRKDAAGKLLSLRELREEYKERRRPRLVRGGIEYGPPR